MAASIAQPPPSVFGRTGSERTMKHIRAIDLQNIKKRAREKTEMTLRTFNKESLDWASSLRNSATMQTKTVKTSPKLDRSISFPGHALRRSRSNLDRNLLENMSLMSRVKSNLTSKLPKWRTKSDSSRNAVAPGRLERRGSIDELVTSRKPSERGRPGRMLRNDAVILSSNNIGKGTTSIVAQLVVVGSGTVKSRVLLGILQCIPGTENTLKGTRPYSVVPFSMYFRTPGTL